MNVTSPSSNSAFASPQDALKGGLREAAGVPMMVMSASFLGFGSMIHNVDWSPWMGVLSTLTTWALPGQIAMAEMAYTGAPLVAIVLAVFFINARLLPLVASLLPHMRNPETPKWKYYAVAMLIAATSWVGVMRRLPDLGPDQRMSYLVGYGLTLYLSSPIATFIGYHLAGSVPQPVTYALVFLNPMYFMLLFLFDMRNVEKILSLAIGAVMGPSLFVVMPNWSLIITGLLGGTLAWALGRTGPAQRVQRKLKRETPGLDEEGGVE